MLAADPRREALFELADERPFGGDPAGPYTFGEVALLVAVEQRLIDRDHRTPIISGP